MHFPFCRSKCPYCAFTSFTDADMLIERYCVALKSEIRQRLSEPFHTSPRTVYFGGGTPSLVPSQLLKRVAESLSLDQSVEFTVEANPESISLSWLEGIREAGANRLSIGVQSLDNRVLRSLGRIHLAHDAIRSIVMAQKAGFSNISVDLMFGVPDQTVNSWENTLHAVLDMQPSHISCYSLGIEEDTVFFHRAQHGNLPVPGHDRTADMYMAALEFLESAGYVRYELSNFALPGYECRHNKSYWNFTPYIGIGAAAHSFDCEIRRWNVGDVREYLRRMENGKNPTDSSEFITGHKRLVETVMLSLRTREGLNPADITLFAPESSAVVRKKIGELTMAGFLMADRADNITLTPRGTCIANEIIAEILADL